MTSQIIPVEPFDLIMFGATGDLAERKLLPSLYRRQTAGQFSEPTRIIGASRTKMTTDEFRETARRSINEYVRKDEIDGDHVERFLARLFYVSVDAKSGDGFAELKETIGECHAIRVF